MSEEIALRTLLNKAMQQLEVSQKKLKKYEDALVQPIAVIGMSCRFPAGANSLDTFWEKLLSGTDLVTEIPKMRWDVDAYYSPEAAPDKMYTRRGAFLQEDLSLFDASFFNISPKEAETMDPQQRLLLEVVWEALENANIPANTLKGREIGFFLGEMNNDYRILLSEANEYNAYIGSGNAPSAAAGRVSYILGLQGPCMAIDTACSSSLVALNAAIQSIHEGESELAIVAGVNLILSPKIMVYMCQAKMLSPDGYCKTFDESADGYSRGEGCGAVILKPLPKAKRDKDNIWAIVRGIAVNQDGAGSGLTVPNANAQERLIRSTLTKAGLQPEDIDYIEAHGTGTHLGDPIEIRALTQVYGERKNKAEKTLVISSTKPYLGHLESAAGIAGIIRTILSMKHHWIPEHLHFKTLNPAISLIEMGASIPVCGAAWPDTGLPKRASVSSFGFSGINAHVILEEAEKIEECSAIELPEYLFCFSAKTEWVLQNLIELFGEYIAKTNEALFNISYTLNTCRESFEYRAVIIATDKEQLLEKIINKIFIGMRPCVDIECDRKHNFFSNTNFQEGKHVGSLLQEMALAFLHHEHVNWNLLYGEYKHNLTKVSLPTYPFERKSYWFKKTKAVSSDIIAKPEWRLIKRRLPSEKLSGDHLHWGLVGAPIDWLHSLQICFESQAISASGYANLSNVDNNIQAIIYAFLEVEVLQLSSTSDEIISYLKQNLGNHIYITILVPTLPKKQISMFLNLIDTINAVLDSKKCTLIVTDVGKRQKKSLLQTLELLRQNPASGELYFVEGGKISCYARSHIDNQSNYLIKEKLAEDPQYTSKVKLSLTEVIEYLTQEVSIITGIPKEEVKIDQGFMDMGMDSLMIVELSKRLSEKLGEHAKIQGSELYAYPNIHKLAEYFCGELQHLGHQINEPKNIDKSDIAIVGMSCRFPGHSNSPETYWDFLINKGNGIITASNERRLMTNAPEDVEWKAGFIDNIEYFDPSFFNISSKEADYMDPQQRLLLMVCWEALERANYKPSSLKQNRTGVFVGAAGMEYAALTQQDEESNEKSHALHSVTGTLLSAISGRISYALGLEGPSMVVDTACSSSLVALHMACDQLTNGTCDVALVAGVALELSFETTRLLRDANLLSPTNSCKTFDINADGFVRGEGCGAIVLKRLSEALKDGDNILAVVKASALNQNGISCGFAAPNGTAQRNLFKEALIKSDISANDISYIEVMGVGAKLGDGIEVDAINAVYGQSRITPIILGAVKTNIGHTETCSGIASIIKVVLAMQYQKIPANINFSTLNPEIRLGDNIKLLQEATAWHSADKSRIAAINAFGITGTNAHVILQEAPDIEKSKPVELSEHLFCLSAKTKSALEKQIELFTQYIAQTTEALSNISYTLNTCREAFDYRVAIIATDKENLHKKLTNKIFVGADPCVRPERGTEHNFVPNTTFEENGHIDSPLREMALAYLHHEIINWNDLYGKHKKQLNKILMPTYPFELKAFWITKKYHTEADNKNKVQPGYLLSLLKQCEINQRESILKNELIQILKNTLLLSQDYNIEENQNFVELGMNSLRAIELSEYLQAIIGVEYYLTKTLLLEKNNVFLLSEYLLDILFNKESASQSSHLGLLKTLCIRILPDADAQIFIFPPLGFGVESCKIWADKIPGKANIWVFGDESEDNWAELIAKLLTQAPSNDLPTSIFAHSFGSLIAYKFLIKAQEGKTFNITRFITSCFPSPHFSAVINPFSLINYLGTIPIQEAKDLLISLEILPDGFSDLILSNEAIRNQFKLYQSIICSKENECILDCPIVAIYAEEDTLVKTCDSVADWARYTQNIFELKKIKLGHSYFLNPPNFIFPLLWEKR